jgi:hypothetical protein
MHLQLDLFIVVLRGGVHYEVVAFSQGVKLMEIFAQWF